MGDATPSRRPPARAVGGRASEAAGEGPRGAAGRVAAVQGQVRPTLLRAAAFAVAGGAAVVPHGSGRWLPLHLFLAGGLVLAVSGAWVADAVVRVARRRVPGRRAG